MENLFHRAMKINVQNKTFNFGKILSSEILHYSNESLYFIQNTLLSLKFMILYMWSLNLLHISTLLDTYSNYSSISFLYHFLTLTKSLTYFPCLSLPHSPLHTFAHFFIQSSHSSIAH